jgi:hypothetical protein
MWPNLYRSFKRGSQYPIIILKTRNNKMYPFQIFQNFVRACEVYLPQDLSPNHIYDIIPEKFLYQGFIEKPRGRWVYNAGVEIHYHDGLIPLVIKLSKKILLTKNNIIIDNHYKLPITDQAMKTIQKLPDEISIKNYHNVQLEIREPFIQ